MDEDFKQWLLFLLSSVKFSEMVEHFQVKYLKEILSPRHYSVTTKYRPFVSHDFT